MAQDITVAVSRLRVVSKCKLMSALGAGGGEGGRGRWPRTTERTRRPQAPAHDRRPPARPQPPQLPGVPAAEPPDLLPARAGHPGAAAAARVPERAPGGAMGLPALLSPPAAGGCPTHPRGPGRPQGLGARSLSLCPSQPVPLLALPAPSTILSSPHSARVPSGPTTLAAPVFLTRTEGPSPCPPEAAG